MEIIGCFNTIQNSLCIFTQGCGVKNRIKLGILAMWDVQDPLGKILEVIRAQEVMFSKMNNHIQMQDLKPFDKILYKVKPSLVCAVVVSFEKLFPLFYKKSYKLKRFLKWQSS